MVCGRSALYFPRQIRLLRPKRIHIEVSQSVKSVISFELRIVAFEPGSELVLLVAAIVADTLLDGASSTTT